MRRRTLDEMVSYFNQQVSEMDIDRSYKILLLGMVSAIAYGVQKPHWIPCSERLPEEDGGLYLVTEYAKSVNRRRMHVSRCYMNKDGFWSDVPLGYKVVAWMPLPEPYQKEGGE